MTTTDTTAEYVSRVFKVAESYDDGWGDLIDLLVDPEGTVSFMDDAQRNAPLTVLIVGASEEQLRDIRLSAEICPVHHVDAEICADDGVGDGREHCGETLPRLVALADLRPGDVLDQGVFARFEADPHPAGRAGWVWLTDGYRYSESEGAQVRVWSAAKDA